MESLASVMFGISDFPFKFCAIYITEYLFQVCIYLIGSIPAAYDKCLITWTPLWHFVWLCMYVSSFTFENLSFHHCSFWKSCDELGKLEKYLQLSTFSDTYGLFNFLIPGPSFYSAIESSSWLVSIFDGAGW